MLLEFKRKTKFSFARKLTEILKAQIIYLSVKKLSFKAKSQETTETAIKRKHFNIHKREIQKLKLDSENWYVARHVASFQLH